MTKIFSIILMLPLIFSCSNNELEQKGFPVSNSREGEPTELINGLNGDTINFETRPANIILTGNAEHRLTPVFKVNYNKKTQKSFIGSIEYHQNYGEYGEREGNQWNQHIMPGIEAVCGYNFVNISHFNNQNEVGTIFFENPVLIKTLYYPAFSVDTLNKVPILRKYYMVSVYDEDTNNDNLISTKDLRRFYYFDINAMNKTPIVPINYSVMSSEYDPVNDYMYVVAKLDENSNGQMDEGEEIQIFWLDLKNPEKKGLHYKPE